MKGANTPPLTRQLIEICRNLHLQGFLAAADGNLSYREHDRIVITPSGVAKTALKPEDMAEITLDGVSIRGTPSSEKPMHLAIYQHCPGAGAVIHAHPPCAIALTIARPDLQWLPEGALSELILALGKVPIAPYARPSTPELAGCLLPYLPDYKAIILSRHGVVCWGESLEEANYGVERIEHAAKVLCLALQMGGISELPQEEIAALKAMREKIGNRTL